MAQIIGLPKLSPTMEEGVLARWTKKEGDKVEPGDIIAEVETDKANMDFPLEDQGAILKLLVGEGDTVRLGAPVLILGEPGEDTAALEKEAKGGGAAAPKAEPKKEAKAAPKEDVEEGEEQAAPEQEAAAEKKPAAVDKKKAPAAPAPAPKKAPAGNGAGKHTILASPLAKTLAAENGVDLRSIQGTGPGGRIVERDVQSAMEGGTTVEKAPEKPKQTARPAPERITQDVDKPLSPLRKTLARRLVEAKSTIPHFYLTADCNAGPLLEFREEVNQVAGDEEKVSVNDLIVKAAALTLRRVPTVNATFAGDSIRYLASVNIGVAVAIEDGLLTPVVFDADSKGLLAIRAEIRDLAGRAKNKKVKPEEMTGSTFTVSNLGMFGIDHFEAIINPPEACILAVGRVRREPVVNDMGVIAVGERMALTLSCDHRVVDGALGAKFLGELVNILEHPGALAL